MRCKALVIFAVSFSLVISPALGESAAAVGKMTTRGTAEVNGAVAPAEGSVFSGDRIASRVNSVVALALPGGDQVFLPERTAAQVEQKGARVRVSLERGALAVVSRGANPVGISARGVLVEASGASAVFEVAVNEVGLKVLSRHGVTRVRAADRTLEVKEGMTLDATTTPAPQTPAGAGAGGLSTLQTTVLVVATAVGIAGFTLGALALRKSDPEDCRVTGLVSPFTITCP